ncbi:unnamed protein product [Auanema sp. JU1783]|nr:unnamed protein product [Auanema sp. JU1783]
MSSAASGSTAEKAEITVVTSVPPSLDKALLLMVKNFFGDQHFLIVYYIMKAVCIREENLRKRLNFEQRELRQKLATLKSEKLVKERLLPFKNESGRSQSIIFYFINYRAILNVLKYKVDHMRQKLEAKEKEDVQRAVYKCEGCASQYETLEVDRILDPYTGTLKCWRCQGEVTQDESGGPTQITRSLLARFNEQMCPLFSAIRELAGIQLAPHLLEPDINQFLAEEDKNNEQQTLVDFTQPNERVALGGKSFSGHRDSNGVHYNAGDEITVDLNADLTNKPMEEAKQVPVWLQDDAITQGTEHAQAAAALISETGFKEEAKQPTDISFNLLVELEGQHTEPAAKKGKFEEPSGASSGAAEENGEDEEEEEEEEDVEVEVQGKKVKIEDVTQEMVESMTDEEKQKYISIVNENVYM